MRSRLTPETLLWSAPACPTSPSGPTRGAGYSARRVGQAKFARAVLTEPDEYVWGIGPEKRTDLARDPHGVVDAQALQGLNVKYAVIKIAVSAFVSMNTLPFTKHVFGHDESPQFPRLVCNKADKFVVLRVSGFNYYV